jgi:hypothetical protein
MSRFHIITGEQNVTVIPLLSGRVNVSYFCSGGITWGRNDPHHVATGWPWREVPGGLRS